MIPAVFLDRDGVIVENRDQYIRSWSDVEIFPDSISALSRYNHLPYKFIIITNQSAIGRGLLPYHEAVSINERLIKHIEKNGGRIDGLFMCPHHPDEHCDCRKPQPGLLHQAAEMLSIDLSQSIMIGDALTDIRAGKNAGIPKNYLVLTGRGSKQVRLPEANSLSPFIVVDNLPEALCHLSNDLQSNTHN